MNTDQSSVRPGILPVLLLLAALSVPALLPAAEPESPVRPPSPGDPAPLFPAQNLLGEEIDLPGLLQGKVALIAFWASWCPPCLDEVPILRLAHRDYRKAGLVVVGLGLRQGGDTIIRQRGLARRYGMEYLTVFDAQDVYKKAYRVRMIPWTMLLGRDGRLVWHGNELPQDLDDRIKTLLAEEDPGEAE